MSTRCNIVLKTGRRFFKDIYLYHHHDGYPEGVGADLVNRLKDHFTGATVEDIANKLVKDLDDEYEITTCLHGDIEYLYVIDEEDKSLYYKPVDFGWDDDGYWQRFGKKVFLIKKGKVVNG